MAVMWRHHWPHSYCYQSWNAHNMFAGFSMPRQNRSMHHRPSFKNGWRLEQVVDTKDKISILFGKISWKKQNTIVSLRISARTFISYFLITWSITRMLHTFDIEQHFISCQHTDHTTAHVRTKHDSTGARLDPYWTKLVSNWTRMAVNRTQLGLINISCQ